MLTIGQMLKRALGVIVMVSIVALTLWFFTTYMIGHFENGVVSGIWLGALFIGGIMGAIYSFTLVPSTLRTSLMYITLLFIVFATVRGTVTAYSKNSVKMFDNAVAGSFFTVGKKINAPFLTNEETAQSYDQKCDEITAKRRGSEEQAAVNKYEEDGDIESLMKQRELIVKRYEAIKGCSTQVLGTVSPAGDSPVNPPPALQSNEVAVAGTSDQWVTVCNTDCTLSVRGQVDYGGEVANPDSSPRLGDKTAKATGIPFGVLIARVGNGKPFKVGSLRTIKSGGKAVSIAINDSDFRDNKGAYIVTKS